MVNEIKSNVAKGYSSPLENKSNPKSQGSITSGEHSKDVLSPSEVSLSEELTSLKKAINDSPDVDVEKVNAVKAQVDSGNYKIDPKVIADKLLNDFS